MPTLPKVYFSYAWGDDKTLQGKLRSEAADALYQELKKRESRGELEVMIDREQMGYKDRIRDFTKQYGESSILIIMIISEKYLLSPYCMGEVVEILSNKDYHKRTFPVVLPDAKLKDGIKLAQYYKDWEKRKRELKAAIDEIEDNTYAGPLIEQQKDIAEIIRIIAGFTTEMGDTLTARPPDYSPLLKALDERIAEMKTDPSKQAILFDKDTPTQFDCYCCNRNIHFHKVAQFLGDSEDAPLLHVFLPSFHHDTPESFVSRVYNECFPTDNRYALEKRNQAGGGEHRNHLKLLEEELHAGTAITNLKRLTNQHSSATYPEYILLFLSIRLKDWSAKEAKAFISDIRNDDHFSAIQGKKIRIFYWLDLTGCLHPGLFKKLFQKEVPLEVFRKHCLDLSHICFLEPLPEVGVDDVKIWFSRFCRYPQQYQPHIDDIFQAKPQLKMADVEPHLSSLVERYLTYR